MNSLVLKHLIGKGDWQKLLGELVEATVADLCGNEDVVDDLKGKLYRHGSLSRDEIEAVLGYRFPYIDFSRNGIHYDGMIAGSL